MVVRYEDSWHALFHPNKHYDPSRVWGVNPSFHQWTHVAKGATPERRHKQILGNNVWFHLCMYKRMHT